MDVHASVNHVVARTKHETRDALNGGNFLAGLKTLQGFDLGDEADVVVGSLDVVGIVGIKRLC